MKSTAYENYASTDDLVRDLLDICILTLLPVFGVLFQVRTGLSELNTFALPVGLAFSAPKVALVPVMAILSSALLIRQGNPLDKPDGKVEGSPGFIRCTRGSLSFLTTVCILAVDFPAIFPRSMAKTETYGLSVMDVGVGAVILASAINRRSLTASGNFRVFITRTLPALVLGFGRFIFVKEADYYVSSSEYGVHWNFFVTLWVVAVVGEFIKRVVSYFFRNLFFRDLALFTLAAGLAIVPSYLVEVHLSEWWFFFGERVGTPSFPAFFAANREGIVSSLGFIALDLAGSAVARAVKSGNLVVLIGGFIGSLAVFAGLLEIGEFPSRRMANVAFCAAVSAVTFFNLSAFRVALGTSYRVPRILAGILKQPLLFFLLSNALTGVINMNFQTLLFPKAGALAIMTAYITCLWILASFL